MAHWWQRYRERAEREPRRPAATEPRLAKFRWLLEELRVSLFAQELKTPFPVSYKRVEKAWSELADDSAAAALPAIARESAAGERLRVVRPASRRGVRVLVLSKSCACA